ncbi:MAG: TetR/AcrR family transcriptional regulator [Myxococcota bacterium]
MTRRTQAERTASTRGRILRAAVESLAQVGYQRTTANEITRRAGVTWGAVQHHFGDKEGILDAVIEASFERFEARLGDFPGADTPLEARVAHFVDRAWEHFGSAEYRSTFEILANHARGLADADPPPWHAHMFRSWDRVWSQFFADAALPRRRQVALQTHTIAVLTGMASLDMLGRTTDVTRAELDLLKRTLLREMQD